MFKWFKSSTLDPLNVSMAGAKLGDRLIVMGCSDPQLIAALASKTGLTGRAVAVDETAQRVEEAGRIALAEGALIETAVAPLNALPFDADAFDLAILRDVLAVSDEAATGAIAREAVRVLRPGGRCMVMNTVSRGGMAALLGGKTSAEPSVSADALSTALKSIGFVAVRTLAEREGTVFVEGVKRNTP